MHGTRGRDGPNLRSDELVVASVRHPRSATGEKTMPISHLQISCDSRRLKGHGPKGEIWEARMKAGHERASTSGHGPTPGRESNSDAKGSRGHGPAGLHRASPRARLGPRELSRAFTVIAPTLMAAFVMAVPATDENWGLAGLVLLASALTVAARSRCRTTFLLFAERDGAIVAVWAAAGRGGRRRLAKAVVRSIR